MARGSTAEVRSLLYVIEDSYPELQQDVEAVRGDIVAAGQLLSGLIRSTQRRRGLNWLACALPILIAILLL